MSAFDSNDQDSHDEALWSLLGKTRDIEPSPYFARKVLRAIENHSVVQPAWWTNFLRLFAPVGVCAGLAIFAGVGIQRTNTSSATANAEIEFETIQNLDLLVSNYESSLWLDPSSPSY